MGRRRLLRCLGLGLLLNASGFVAVPRQTRPRVLRAGAGWWDQLVWNAAEALGNVRGAAVGNEEVEMGEVPQSREELVQRLRADYDRNYFLTGDIDVPLYTEDCEFADPFTSFKGRQRFVQNLKRLTRHFGPLFILMTHVLYDSTVFVE